jgi:polyhydroxybutyrate depolymerase
MSVRRRFAWPLVVRFGIVLTAVSVFAAIGRIEMAVAGAAEGSGTLDLDGRTRTYHLHVPPGYDGKTPAPLVLVLHGAGQSPASAEKMSGLSAKADQENFLVVYPSGTGLLRSMPTWNSGACCGYAMKNNVNDVAFLGALINKLEQEYAVDRKRVFVTGISNGGMMSYRLACELADTIAAIAPVEGAQDTPCHPSSPLSVVIFHGTADRLVPFHGGTTPFPIGSQRSDTPVADTVSFWVREDGCLPVPRQEETGVLRADLYSGCKEGTAVELYAIPGGHHSWPGTRTSGNDVAATDLIWSFFSTHPKP